MFQPNSGKDHLVATKKTRTSVKGNVHAATYHVKRAAPNAGYSSSSLRNSTEQLLNIETNEIESPKNKIVQEFSGYENYENQGGSKIIPKTQASGGGGKPPTNTGRGSFSATPNGPNPFTFLDSIATPRAPKWGGGPTRHNVSSSFNPSDEVALANLSQSLHKVNQKFSSEDLKKVFSTVS